MNKFDLFNLDVARRAAAMSHAIRLKAGAVIAKDNNILAYGYNGTPAGEDNCCEEKVYEYKDTLSKDAEYPYSEPGYYGQTANYRLVTKDNVIHAEENAILKAARSTQSVEGASMYVTHAPCIKCARMIHSVGIIRLVYNETYRSAEGLNLLKSKSIKIEHVPKFS